MEQNSGITTTIYNEEAAKCKEAAKRLSRVITWMKDNGYTNMALSYFAHSGSCHAEKCLSICKLFRRVRRHCVLAEHRCSILRLYAVLLRTHVSSCTNDNCGLKACPTLRAIRKDEQMERTNQQQLYATDTIIIKTESTTLPEPMDIKIEEDPLSNSTASSSNVLAQSKKLREEDIKYPIEQILPNKNINQQDCEANHIIKTEPTEDIKIEDHPFELLPPQKKIKTETSGGHMEQEEQQQPQTCPYGFEHQLIIEMSCVQHYCTPYFIKSAAATGESPTTNDSIHKGNRHNAFEVFGICQYGEHRFHLRLTCNHQHCKPYFILKNITPEPSTM